MPRRGQYSRAADNDYPPLKGSPGAVVCTKSCHGKTEMHMNEETGWVWWHE
jgi:hypothetical protein